ncbi:AN1-type zinc finger protein 1-like [Galleria mellonella]|uniref:AN1-type zinc finger protein 1-like n=1 Tax=Galleria mellonella TaxID=7137 RepID=A0A6J1WZD4_GALME|nr:AN1-type zinc finger protein 1-like [Galleria mellonella]
MEFPTLGEHCQYPNCNQTDFLPLQCKCAKVFCRVHFNEHCLSGDCELAPEPKAVNLKNDDQIYRCSEKGCRKGNLHEMLCAKCNKHYCIEHRFHPTCPEIDDETMATKIEQFEAPRKQFAEANKHLQEKITENIRKALQSSAKVKTASKIQLMRIKQKAIGPKSIPVSDRVYFAVTKPKSMEPKAVKVIQDANNLSDIESVSLDPDLKDSVPLFISSKWSLGRAIDTICDSCNIKNDNNKMAGPKLRLFRQLDKYCVYPLKMDVEIGDLIQKEILLEGDKLLIEYIDSEILSSLNDYSQLFLS